LIFKTLLAAECGIQGAGDFGGPCGRLQDCADADARATTAWRQNGVCNVFA